MAQEAVGGVLGGSWGPLRQGIRVNTSPPWGCGGPGAPGVGPGAPGAGLGSALGWPWSLLARGQAGNEVL